MHWLKICAGYLIISSLSGCATTSQTTPTAAQQIDFNQQIINAFKDREQHLLIKAIENSKYIQGLTRFDIAIEINDFYKKNGVNRFDFYNFLKENMDSRDDIEENIINQIEKAYQLLEKMQNEK